MRKFTLFTLLILSVVGASAQQAYWTSRSDKNGITTDKAVARQSFPKEFKLFALNAGTLRQELFSITGNQAARRTTIISLPNADGNVEQFEVVEASNFEPALQARFPGIRAFSGRGITDRSATLKLSISPQGIQTMVFRTDKPNEYIEPYSQDHTVYAVFKSARQKGALPWLCTTQDQQLAAGINAQVSASRIESNNGNLKTMRLAQSCNGEYSNFFGAFNSSQVALVLAAFNATLTRANGCYEKDLAIHLNLVSESVNVIYYDPATDPYTTLGNWNTQLQIALNTSLTGPGTPIEANNAAYDIGHMFGASGGGGNAGCIGCVCVDGVASGTGATKGRGITSPADGIPQGDNFDIDYVVHEVGHQLGGNHTFSMSNEGVGVNKEVGSGITIMGYAGITNQDVAPHSIDIFHQTSIEQIQANLAPKTCPITTSLAGINATPVVAALSNYTIPPSTPFALTGSATDADAGDVLTYCWEQNNDGAGQTGNNSVARENKPSGPNWLTFPATTSATRLMPRLSTILTGANLTGPLPGGDAIANIEALSNVSRTLNFRLTARDNRPYNGTAVGQTNFQDMIVTVDAATYTPFLITSQNTAVSYSGGTTQTVTWSVGNTTAAPISTANVKISFSTDGGLTFPTVLAASTANDGSENIVIPIGLTTTGRIKVEAIGNIFFDINNASITVVAPPAGFSFNSPAPIVSSCPTPTSLSTNLTATYFGGHSANINLTAAVVPSGSVTLTPATLTTGTTTAQVTLNNTNLLPPGNYTVTVTGTSTGVTTQTRDIVFTITPSAPVITTQPVGQTVCTGTNVTFTVVASGATGYQWQLSTDNGSNWGNVGAATSATYTVVAPTTAQNGHQYRVITSSICGSTTSNAVILNVVAPATITTQPVSATICEGGNASFSVVATTSIGVLTYQWELSTNGGTSWSSIPGATASIFAQTNIPVGQNGYRFRVIVSSGCGSVTSSVAIITVNAFPVITFTPSPVVCRSDAGFSISASPAGGVFSGPGVTGSVFTPSVATVGPKAVTYTVSNAGCQSVVTRTIQVNECAERRITLDQFPAVVVYPVPNRGSFNIRLNTELYSKLNIKLYNNLGSLVKSESVSGLTYGSVIPVQATNLPYGTYSLFLSNDESGAVSRGLVILIAK